MGTAQQGKRHLCNSTHVQQGLPVAAATTTPLAQGFHIVPRCACVVTVAGVTIANVHLSGGRYDDAQAPRNPTLKTQQVAALVEAYHPDLIMGDFNGEPTVPDVLKSYLHHINVPVAVFQPYFTAGHAYLRDSGYHAVPATSLTGSPVTSKFGTTPDWVYYLPTRLAAAEARVVDFVTEDFTDHNAIVARFAYSPAAGTGA